MITLKRITQVKHGHNAQALLVTNYCPDGVRTTVIGTYYKFHKGNADCLSEGQKCSLAHQHIFKLVLYTCKKRMKTMYAHYYPCPRGWNIAKAKGRVHRVLER